MVNSIRLNSQNIHMAAEMAGVSVEELLEKKMKLKKGIELNKINIGLLST